MSKKITNSLIIILSLVIVGILSYLFLFNNNKVIKVQEVQSIVLNKNIITLESGLTEKLEVSILPDDAKDKTIIWSSDNSSIASVTDDGTVTANSVGHTTIRVKSKDGNVNSICIVYVEKKKIEDITLDKETLDLLVGEKNTLQVTITPSELQDEQLTWTSSNPSVAKVDENGEIEALSQGTATIIVSSSDGLKSVSCTVNVTDPTVSVSGVSLQVNSLIIVSGGKETLSATVSPTNATDKSVTWSSSNSNVVSVDNGKLTANSTGTATITVTTTDGRKTATCSVKVVGIKTFNQQNEAVTAYFNNASNIKGVYSKYKRIDSNIYKTSLSGEINVYQYNSNNNTKDLITTTKSSNINYALHPGKTYYLESKSDTSNVEVVKITGTIRAFSSSKIGTNNFRDLGGWKTEEGTTIKYGKIYRSATTSKLSEANLSSLNITRIVDLRAGGAGKDASEASKKIRKVIGVEGYIIDNRVRSAVTEIMKSVVNGKNVLFNCAIGRDRTGTVAYTIEGILGVTLESRKRDYELSYFAYPGCTRSYGRFVRIINYFNNDKKYSKDKYEQERFIKWYLEGSSNKSSDLELINNFRKKMIDGNPKEYKLSGSNLVLA